MADAPWRCSQCGTVNEPNANACRSCGRWPSLFELEGSTLEGEPATVETTYRDDASLPEVSAAPDVAVEPAEQVETAEEGTRPRHEKWPGPEDPMKRAGQGWPGRLASLLVPILIVLYIVISALVDR